MNRYIFMDVKKNLKIIVILAVLFFIPSFCTLLFEDTFRLWNARVNDLFFQLRFLINGPEKIAPDLYFINITDSFNSKYTDNHLDRTIYAHALEKLHSAGVKTIIYDIFFKAKRLSRGDSKLINATAESGNTYYPFYIDRHAKIKGQSGVTPLVQKVLFFPRPQNNTANPPMVRLDTIHYPFEELALVAAGLGFSNADPDRDGIKRRIPLFYQTGQGYLPSLILSGICDFFQVDIADIEIYYNQYVKLADARYNGIKKDFIIPIDKKGQLVINFPGPAEQSLTQYPMDRVIEKLELEGSLLPGLIRNTLVFIGDISTTGKDFGRGIFDQVYPNSFVMASALNMILTENYLSVPGPVQNGALYLLALLLVFLFLFASRNYNSQGFLIFFLLYFFLAFLLISAFSFCIFIFLNKLARIVEILLGTSCAAFGLFAAKLLDFHSMSGPDQEGVDSRISGLTPDGRTSKPITALEAMGIVTERQQETALLLLKGLTNKEIAAILFISVHAVKRRVHKIYRKCKVGKRTELIKKVYGIK